MQPVDPLYIFKGMPFDSKWLLVIDDRCSGGWGSLDLIQMYIRGNLEYDTDFFDPPTPSPSNSPLELPPSNSLPPSPTGSPTLPCQRLDSTAMLDICFVIDESGSVGGAAYTNVINIVADIMEFATPENTRCCIVTFASNVDLELTFFESDNFGSIRKAAI